MSGVCILTLLAKVWNHDSAQRFWEDARALGMANATTNATAFTIEDPRPLPGSGVWMQRASLPSEMDAEHINSLSKNAEALGLDVFVEAEALYRTPRRLFVFDMDSTLIQAEIVDELAGLAGLAGVKPEVSRVTEAAMRGEIDFATSLTRRVALLKGIPEAQIGQLQKTIALGDGLEELMRGLKAAHCKTAILSGGFTFFARYLQQRLGFDYICANELEIVDGKLTGRLAAPVVDGKRKAAALCEIANQEFVGLEQTVAAGDGANDLPMIELAGTGVAYHAKPLVRASAPFRLNFCGLDALLHLVERN